MYRLTSQVVHKFLFTTKNRDRPERLFHGSAGSEASAESEAGYSAGFRSSCIKQELLFEQRLLSMQNHLLPE